MRTGEFKIKWEKVGKLVVSFIGYRSDTIEVKSTDKFVTCTLKSGEQLDEVSVAARKSEYRDVDSGAFDRAIDHGRRVV